VVQVEGMSEAKNILVGKYEGKRLFEDSDKSVWVMWA
jgi:hypothetical protein